MGSIFDPKQPRSKAEVGLGNVNNLSFLQIKNLLMPTIKSDLVEGTTSMCNSSNYYIVAYSTSLKAIFDFNFTLEVDTHKCSGNIKLVTSGSNVVPLITEYTKNADVRVFLRLRKLTDGYNLELAFFGPHTFTNGTVYTNSVQSKNVVIPLASLTQNAGDLVLEIELLEGVVINGLYVANPGTAYNKNFGPNVGDVPDIGSNLDASATVLTTDVNKKLITMLLNASAIVVTDSNKRLTTESKSTAFNKNFGTTPGLVPEIGASFSGSKNLETDANGKLITIDKLTAFNKNFGSSSGTVCEGNDSRLSNSRKCNNTFDDPVTAASNMGVYTKVELERLVYQFDEAPLTSYKSIPPFGRGQWCDEIQAGSQDIKVTQKGMHVHVHGWARVRIANDPPYSEFLFRLPAWISLPQTTYYGNCMIKNQIGGSFEGCEVMIDTAGHVWALHDTLDDGFFDYNFDLHYLTNLVPTNT